MIKFNETFRASKNCFSLCGKKNVIWLTCDENTYISKQLLHPSLWCRKREITKNLFDLHRWAIFSLLNFHFKFTMLHYVRKRRFRFIDIFPCNVSLDEYTTDKLIGFASHLSDAFTMEGIHFEQFLNLSVTNFVTSSN